MRPAPHRSIRAGFARPPGIFARGAAIVCSAVVLSGSLSIQQCKADGVLATPASERPQQGGFVSRLWPMMAQPLVPSQETAPAAADTIADKSSSIPGGGQLPAAQNNSQGWPPVTSNAISGRRSQPPHGQHYEIVPPRNSMPTAPSGGLQQPRFISARNAGFVAPAPAPAPQFATVPASAPPSAIERTSATPNAPGTGPSSLASSGQLEVGDREQSWQSDVLGLWQQMTAVNESRPAAADNRPVSTLHTGPRNRRSLIDRSNSKPAGQCPGRSRKRAKLGHGIVAAAHDAAGFASRYEPTGANPQFAGCGAFAGFTRSDRRLDSNRFQYYCGIQT
jgi:hypothetical protein